MNCVVCGYGIPEGSEEWWPLEELGKEHENLPGKGPFCPLCYWTAIAPDSYLTARLKLGVAVMKLKETVKNALLESPILRVLYRLMKWF